VIAIVFCCFCYLDSNVFILFMFNCLQKINSVQAHIENHKTSQSFVTKLRGEAMKFTKKKTPNPFEKTEETIFLDRDYFEDIQEYLETEDLEQGCLIPLENILPPLEEEMCKCVAQVRNLTFGTVDEKFVNKKCLELDLLAIPLDSNEYEYLFTATFSCKAMYNIHELAVQAMNHKGMPYGLWKIVDDKTKCINNLDSKVRPRILTNRPPFTQDCPTPKSAHLLENLHQVRI